MQGQAQGDCSGLVGLSGDRGAGGHMLIRFRGAISLNVTFDWFHPQNCFLLFTVIIVILTPWQIDCDDMLCGNWQDESCKRAMLSALRGLKALQVRCPRIKT